MTATRAALLYRKLEPYADVNVVIGLAAVCLGSAESFLGKLAATMGRAEVARGHFERALAANARLRAPGCLARTQVDYARALGLGFSRGAELVAAAERAAAELGLGAVARKVAALSGGGTVNIAALAAGSLTAYSPRPGPGPGPAPGGGTGARAGAGADRVRLRCAGEQTRRRARAEALTPEGDVRAGPDARRGEQFERPGPRRLRALGRGPREFGRPR